MFNLNMLRQRDVLFDVYAEWEYMHVALESCGNHGWIATLQITSSRTVAVSASKAISGI
jgi:hypothetical protein